MDKEVVGSGFYVMEYIEGRIFTDVRLPTLSSSERKEWSVSSMVPGGLLTSSWRSAIDTLTRLSSIPLDVVVLPSTFAPKPEIKPYFPRQVGSLLKVSLSQSKVTSPEGRQTGEIWGTKELRPYFEHGSKLLAEDENKRGVGSIVHGDFKLDNLVRVTLCEATRNGRLTLDLPSE
jgi:aminoglycoside phosphotransferase (APT) family kinase protein